ncbi:aldo/keto reductase [Marinomonas balearica]|uniref:Putative oxidoreductase n=1 Tax=Marinomonas balearica TaxID=491947 RepID=A0A4R6M8M5_9GAMM|nr:aldo/keto reductase [Marinomonas balearica]TDO96960.1 putative oxidoreductase [Marinomonas balearica]
MKHQYHPLGFEGSRLSQGFWRMNEWGFNPQERLRFIEQSIDLGVTTFDHADIYGDYRCESLFGDALAIKPDLRKSMQLITKCGIHLPCEQRPDVVRYRYDHTAEHIIRSAEQSLANLKTDYLDLLLLHRPSPLMDPDGVADAFEHLFTLGKVKHFGVSNFSPAQFDLLQSRLETPLIVNQIELSVLEPKHIEDDMLNHLQQHAVTPMAWSPLGGGALFGEDQSSKRLCNVRQIIQSIANELNVSMDQVALAWLLKHPSRICPILGSGKVDRLSSAVGALNVAMSDDHWFDIWEASRGERLP